MILAVGMSHTAFIMFRYILSTPTLSRFFFSNHERMVNFVKRFFRSCLADHTIFMLHPINVVYPIN